MCIPEKWSMLYWVDCRVWRRQREERRSGSAVRQEGETKVTNPELTSKGSLFWTLFSAAIQSSISFLFSAHRISLRQGVISCTERKKERERERQRSKTACVGFTLQGEEEGTDKLPSHVNSFGLYLIAVLKTVKASSRYRNAMRPARGRTNKDSRG